MNKLQHEVVRIIKEYTPQNMQPINILIDILPMSKEAAYRRLRGEIDFSFTEIVKLSQTFNVSLDSLIKEEYSNYILPDVVQIVSSDKNNSIDNYCLLLEYVISCIRKTKESANPIIFSNTHHILSHPYIFKYKNISKFRFYRYLYFQNEDIDKNFSDFIVPDKIITLEYMLYKEALQIKISYVHLMEIAQIYVTDINYFYKLGVLSEKDAEIQKNEALSLINDINHDSITGRNNYNVPFTLYVSNINFQADCVYFFSEYFETVIVQLFGFNFYSFNDYNSIIDMKNWMKNLISSSTQITSSAEKQRYEFFQKQEKTILEGLTISALKT